MLHNSSYRQAWLHYESESNFRLNLAAMESYESIVGEVEYLDMVEVSDSSDLNVITTKSAHEIGKLFEQDLGKSFL